MKLKPIPNEKGWIIRSPCDRVWFLSYEKVVQDYIICIMEADSLTEVQSKVFTECCDMSFWLYDQYIWSEVDRDGILLTPRIPKKYVKFLDYWREWYNVTSNCKEVNWDD